MNYELGVAGRYLWSARRQAHTAFLTLISTLGLAVGVATLIVSLALLSGLQGEIKARLIASNPQLVVESATSRTIQNSEALVEHARKSGAVRSRKLIGGVAYAANERSGAGRPVRIQSFDPQAPPTAETSFGREWKVGEGSFEDAIFVTRDFAAGIGLTLGDPIVIVSPRTRLTPLGPVPVFRKFTITRLLASGSDATSPDALLSFAESGRTFGTGLEPTSVELFVAPGGETDTLQQDLIRTFPGLIVKSWKEINRPLFLALRLEKIVMFATISLIIFVAALNLVSCLSMVILEKRPQVGVLRTLGSTEGSILAIFLTVGLLVGVSGTIIGNLLGLGAAWSANHFHLVPLPGDAYYMSYVPFTIEAGDVIFVNVLAIVLSVLATWYPARIASRLDPVTAIRGE